MGKYHDAVYGVMHLLGAANAIANPILYGYMNENFRSEYKKFYRKMPWYNPSLVLVRSIRRNFHNNANEEGQLNQGLVNEESLSLPPKVMQKKINLAYKTQQGLTD